MSASSNGRTAISAQPPCWEKLEKLDDLTDIIQRHQNAKDETGFQTKEKPKWWDTNLVPLSPVKSFANWREIIEDAKC